MERIYNYFQKDVNFQETEKTLKVRSYKRDGMDFVEFSCDENCDEIQNGLLSLFYNSGWGGPVCGSCRTLLFRKQ